MKQLFSILDCIRHQSVNYHSLVLTSHRNLKIFFRLKQLIRNSILSLSSQKTFLLSPPVNTKSPIKGIAIQECTLYFPYLHLFHHHYQNQSNQSCPSLKTPPSPHSALTNLCRHMILFRTSLTNLPSIFYI
jgi:hypothetical protein